MSIAAARREGTGGSGAEMATIETMPALRRYIGTCIERGVSMRMALAAFRAGGGKVRTDDFAVLWRDEQRKRDEAPA